MKNSIWFIIALLFLSTLKVVGQKHLATFNFGGTAFRTIYESGSSTSRLRGSLKTPGSILGIGYKVEINPKIYSQTQVEFAFRAKIIKNGVGVDLGRGWTRDLNIREELGILKKRSDRTHFGWSFGLFTSYSKTWQRYNSSVTNYGERRLVKTLAFGISPKFQYQLSEKISILATPSIDVWGYAFKNISENFDTFGYGWGSADGSLFFERANLIFSIGYKL